MYTCIDTYVYMQAIYVYMQDNYVYMQDDYVYMQDNYVYIIFFHISQNLCSAMKTYVMMSLQGHRMLMHMYVHFLEIKYQSKHVCFTAVIVAHFTVNTCSVKRSDQIVFVSYHLAKVFLRLSSHLQKYWQHGCTE